MAVIFAARHCTGSLSIERTSDPLKAFHTKSICAQILYFRSETKKVYHPLPGIRVRPAIIWITSFSLKGLYHSTAQDNALVVRHKSCRQAVAGPFDSSRLRSTTRASPWVWLPCRRSCLCVARRAKQGALSLHLVWLSDSVLA